MEIFFALVCIFFFDGNDFKGVLIVNFSFFFEVNIIILLKNCVRIHYPLFTFSPSSYSSTVHPSFFNTVKWSSSLIFVERNTGDKANLMLLSFRYCLRALLSSETRMSIEAQRRFHQQKFCALTMHTEVCSCSCRVEN